jgi:hypothetical protein
MDKDQIFKGTGRDLGMRYRRNSAMYGVDWQKDGAVSICSNPSCEKPKFTMMNRKKHCRLCGLIFCGKCTKTKQLIELTGKVEKICLLCVARGGPPMPPRDNVVETTGSGETKEPAVEVEVEVEFEAVQAQHNVKGAANGKEGAATAEDQADVVVEDQVQWDDKGIENAAADNDDKAAEDARIAAEAKAAAEDARIAAEAKAAAEDARMAAEAKATAEDARMAAEAKAAAEDARMAAEAKAAAEDARVAAEAKAAAEDARMAAEAKAAAEDARVAAEAKAAEDARIAAEAKAAEDAAAAAADPFSIPEDKLFDGLRKSLTKNKKAMADVGLESIQLFFHMASFVENESFTSKDIKARSPKPGAQLALAKLSYNLKQMTDASTGLAGLSKKSQVAKEQVLTRIKRIIVKVDTTNAQASTVGKASNNWLHIELDEATGDLTSTCNMNSIEMSAKGIDEKLMAAFGDLALKIAVGDAQIVLENKALKTFRTKYGKDLPVEFDCEPFERAAEFQALSPAEQSAKIARIPLVINAALKSVVKCAAQDDIFKQAFDKRVGKLTFTYDPTSSIKYKARNTTITVKWKAELQTNGNSDSSDPSNLMTLKITQNLDESRGGLDKVKEVFEPALGIGVDEAELLAAAQAAEKAKYAAIKAKYDEAAADKKAAAEERKAARAEEGREARAADRAQKLQNMKDGKQVQAEHKAAHDAWKQERSDKLAAAGENNKARAEEAKTSRAADRAQKLQNMKDGKQAQAEHKAAYQAKREQRAGRQAAAKVANAERQEAYLASRAAQKQKHAANRKAHQQKCADRRAKQQAKEDAKQEKFNAAAAAAEQRAEEADAAREAKKVEWEQQKEAHAAMLAEKKAAKDAGDEAKAQRLAEKIAKNEVKREQARMDSENAKSEFAARQAERAECKAQQQKARDDRQADLTARREAAAVRVQFSRAARSKEKEERLAKAKAQKEEMAAFRQSLKLRKEAAAADAKSAQAEAQDAAAEAKAAREAVDAGKTNRTFFFVCDLFFLIL